MFTHPIQTRAHQAGDILQNILDGCYWKCGLFLGFEGPALIMLYTQAM